MRPLQTPKIEVQKRQHSHCLSQMGFSSGELSRGDDNLRNSAELIHHRDGKGFAVLRELCGHGPHMVDYHIGFHVVEGEHLRSVLQSDFSVFRRVRALRVDVFLSVVKEEIMEKPSPRRGSCVQPEQLA